ncbi:hypothetical protein ABW20_dc0102960 [Dactylellina cionopaga]|nr:hypothetical protein ABW20_dc0102960 [Dactylellina cionopaga]
MSDVKLPVKVRMGIRDSWDAPKCPLREAINALSTLLGAQIDIVVDWGMLWTVLSSEFPDPGTFIPVIEEATRVWADVLQERLDSEVLEEWTDEFLEKVKTAHLTIRLEIGISESGIQRPETLWDKSTEKLKLLFPKKAEIVYRNALQAGFGSDFENLFNRKGVSTMVASTATIPIGRTPAAPAAVDEDGWSVVPPTSGAPPSVATARGVMPQPEAPPEKLPSLAILARPEVLFETQTPYLIYVRKYGDKALHIEGSHHGSLTLICEYFQKWVRKDSNYNGNVSDIFFFSPYEYEYAHGVF